MTEPQQPQHDVSASAIKQLAQCPEAFFKARVARDPRAQDKGHAANVGILVHDALARAARSGLPEVTAADLLGFLAAPLAADAEAQLVGARLDLGALAAARAMAKDVAREVSFERMESLATGPGTAQPMVEQRLTFDVDGARVLAILDRVDAPSAEARVAVDYKTGAEILDRDEMRLDPQALMQAAALRARFPEARVSVEFHWLTRGVVVPLAWDAEVDAFARQVVRDHLAAVRWHEKRAKWPAKPSARACNGCPFRSNCAAYLAALKTGAVVDATKPADLAATVTGFHEATQASKLWDGRKADLGETLRAVLEERGEFPMAGRRVRMGKRATPKFADPAFTLRRAAEQIERALANGEEPNPEHVSMRIQALEDVCESLSVSALREHVESLPLTKGQKRSINEAINETGSLDTATWVETRALPDPFAAALPEDEAGGGADPGGALNSTTAGAGGEPGEPGGVADTSPKSPAPGAPDVSVDRVVPQGAASVASPPTAPGGTGYCSSCGAKVTWGKTPAGKRCPFDADGRSHFATCPQASAHSKKTRTPKPCLETCATRRGGVVCDCRKPRAPRKPKPQMVVVSEVVGAPVERPFLASSPLDGAHAAGIAKEAAASVALDKGDGETHVVEPPTPGEIVGPAPPPSATTVAEAISSLGGPQPW